MEINKKSNANLISDVNLLALLLAAKETIKRSCVEPPLTTPHSVGGLLLCSPRWPSEKERPFHPRPSVRFNIYECTYIYYILVLLFLPFEVCGVKGKTNISRFAIATLIAYIFLQYLKELKYLSRENVDCNKIYFFS